MPLERSSDGLYVLCTNRDLADRDPEAEAEEKVEEEKAAGEEEAAPAVESGFAATGGDWEAAPAGYPTGGENWGDAQPGNWDAAPAAGTTTDWGAAAEAGKDTTTSW